MGILDLLNPNRQMAKRITVPPAETLFNWALGVTLLGWGVRHSGFRHFHLPGNAMTPSFLVVEYALLGLTVLVAFLLVRREAVGQNGSWRSAVSALPTLALGSLLSGGVPPDSWSNGSAGLVLGGAALAGWSFWCLGRSFSILPARRTTVCTGPYRWVRHPGYAGELLILAGCVLSANHRLGAVLWLVTVAAMVPRILAEERLLLQCPLYERYAKATRYRLLPGVF